MKVNNTYLFILPQILIFILSLLTDWYIQLALVSFAVVLVHMVQKLGRGIVLRETVALHTSFICLAMPTLGYTVYTRSNYLGIWIKYMTVPVDVYFSFAIPAVTAFIIALCWPRRNEEKSDEGATIQRKVEQCKEILANPYMKRISLTILLIGFLMFFISDFIPRELQFIFILFFFSAFAGFLYVFYSPSFRYKWAILAFFTLFIFLNAIRTGMFTVVAYMGITLFSFFFLGHRASLAKKLLFFIGGGFCLLILQNVKPEFRKTTWNDEYAGNKTEVFIDLLTKQTSQKSLFSPVAFYAIYSRANQGYNIALVMRRIPKYQPLDNGNNLLRSFASAFVPRFLWPDKPEAGGKFNMQYYAGVTIKGWSTNIGPLGEAYGSFGAMGGVVFMFVLGLCIRWVYGKIFSVSTKIPLIILWIPVFFYQVTYSAETDTLQIFNSLIKSSFFVWILFKLTPAWFGFPRKKSLELPEGKLSGFGTR